MELTQDQKDVMRLAYEQGGGVTRVEATIKLREGLVVTSTILDLERKGLLCHAGTMRESSMIWELTKQGVAVYEQQIAVKKGLSYKEHKKRHEELHEALDELFVDFSLHHSDACSQKTVLEFLKWSKSQAENPVCVIQDIEVAHEERMALVEEARSEVNESTLDRPSITEGLRHCVKLLDEWEKKHKEITTQIDTIVRENE